MGTRRIPGGTFSLGSHVSTTPCPAYSPPPTCWTAAAQVRAQARGAQSRPQSPAGPVCQPAGRVGQQADDHDQAQEHQRGVDQQRNVQAQEHQLKKPGYVSPMKEGGVTVQDYLPSWDLYGACADVIVLYVD